ncbi:MAG TPA: HisA/HisF-related TIM barrel protein [Methylotenera sp.]|nr:HisA/HisF-related TIM barrel protein [Methylotenera sp.]HPV45847.1 HisA/HisF-related TIM barrel protein [Methylotenera sp.]
MQIIPVIDLLDGVVVHAKGGERQHYQPIQSFLTSSSKPLDIVAALLDYFPFQQLYIADLNAIQKLKNTHETNYSVVESITRYFPNLKLWVDAGISNQTELNIWNNLHSNLIFASENFSEIGNFLALKIRQDTHFILSLDFMPTGYRGPAELLRDSAYWPNDVIVMSLPNVGTNQGVNIKLLNEIMPRVTGLNIYAAGGIRSLDDLTLLKKMGVHGALISTAFHQKQISAQQLESLAQSEC